MEGVEKSFAIQAGSCLLYTSFPGRMDDPPDVLLIRTPDRPFQGNAFFLKSTVTDAEIELSRRHRRGDKMAVRV